MWEHGIALTKVKARLREEWGGMALSLALHVLLLLAALWFLAHRPHAEPQAPVLPIELVVAEETSAPGPSATAAAPARSQARPVQDSTPVVRGTRPDSVKPPVDEMTARLQALAQLRQPDSALPRADNDGPGGNGSGAGSYSLKDFVRAQILRRWLPDLSIPGARDLPVLVRVKLLRTGIIDDVEILDQKRFVTDKPFRNMALSARNAALLASPIEMPPGKYERVQMLTIDLDPRAVLR
jgi:hypothetical protein